MNSDSDPDSDEAWFTALVHAHRQDLRNYVRRRIDPAAVDDVVSEVLGAAWRHRDLRPPEPRLWLLRTAQNALLHQFRAQRRRDRLMAKLAGEPAPTNEPAPANEPADGSAAEIVRSCLLRLSDSDQELLRLSYWEQLSVDEISYVVGASAVAVRVRLHRARRRLAPMLPDWLVPTSVPDQPGGAHPSAAAALHLTPTNNGGLR
jgi:RNA polymerase sigma factor (sigma-70 family)